MGIFHSPSWRGRHALPAKGLARELIKGWIPLLSENVPSIRSVDPLSWEVEIV
jgi:hypothetical protein